MATLSLVDLPLMADDISSRWDRLHRDELDIIRDFFRGKPHCSLVQQWLSSDELVRQLTFMGLLRLGWQGAEAFKILNRVLPAATISSRTVSPRPGVNESARSPSQDVVTSIEPSSIHLAPFDGVAPYGPIYDTQAASILERSSPEVEVFELQPFDGSGST